MNLDKVKEILVSHVINFVLIGIVAVSITYYFNQKILELDRDFMISQYEKQVAGKLFADLSVLMNKRLFRMKLLVWHYLDPQYPEEKNKVRQSYQEMIDEWNYALSKNSNLIQFRFGKPMRSKFDDKIHEKFRDLHSQLVDIVREKEKIGEERFISKLNELERDLRPLSDDIDKFNAELLESIEKGEIGRNRIK